jgi:hypothetical protein
MQRSAHKATASSPSTPSGPPSKKARLSNGHAAPGTPGTPDHDIIQSALILEEKKRQEALDKAAQHTGETKWVLSFKDPMDGKRQESLQVKQAGFAEIDAADDSDDDEEEVRPIRKQFGGGLKKREVRYSTLSNQSYSLTLRRNPLLLRRQMSLKGRLSHRQKSMIVTIQQPHSYERLGAKLPQRTASLALHSHGGVTAHRQTLPTVMLVFVVCSLYQATTGRET